MTRAKTSIASVASVRLNVAVSGPVPVSVVTLCMNDDTTTNNGVSAEEVDVVSIDEADEVAVGIGGKIAEVTRVTLLAQERGTMIEVI